MDGVMAELKTQKTAASVEDFLNAIEDETKRADAYKVSAMMRDATGAEPAMWGAAIVGFGHRRLKYESGREIDWMVLGFSPRKANLSLYLPGGFDRLHPLLARLGKHKTGEGCLYIKRLSDVDEGVLREVIVSALSAA